MLFLLILIFALVAQLFLPWWTMAMVAFAIAFWKAQRGGQAFGAGFAAVGLTWLGAALFWQFATEGILTERVTAMLTLPSPWMLVGITVLLGGIVGGLSALSGFLLRRALP